MNISFQNRITAYSTLLIGLFIGLVFVLIFVLSKRTIFSNLDEELKLEASDHYDEMVFDESTVFFRDKKQWAEREHTMVQVSPIFIQLVNLSGEIMDKSPNIQQGNLSFYPPLKNNEQKPIDSELNGQRIRQIQLPIFDQKKKVGFMLVAISSEQAWNLVSTLKLIFWIAFPGVLLILIFLTRFLAAKSIHPVNLITETTNRISKNNLSERIPLPTNNDELFTLTTAINALLARIESAMLREKQFTTDASHELRTPLAIIQGTLEVLIRKARTQAEYEEKIKATIQEVNSLSELLDQLLFIARFENEFQSLPMEKLDLENTCKTWVSENQSRFQSHAINIEADRIGGSTVRANTFLLDLILKNCVSNAVKYSEEGAPVLLKIWNQGERIKLSVIDYGQGIAKKELESIFSPFFRSNSAKNSSIEGVGLGLSIVQKACLLQEIELSIDSEIGNGTELNFCFKS